MRQFYQISKTCSFRKKGTKQDLSSININLLIKYSVQQQFHFNGNVFGNKFCRCKFCRSVVFSFLGIYISTALCQLDLSFLLANDDSLFYSATSILDVEGIMKRELLFLVA